MGNNTNHSSALPPVGVAKIIGRTGYFVREVINETRCKLIRVSDAINELSFALIDKLDRNPNVAYFRRIDRGL